MTIPWSLFLVGAFAADATVTLAPADKSAILRALFAGTKASYATDGDDPLVEARMKKLLVEAGTPRKAPCGNATVRVLAAISRGAAERWVVTGTECEDHGCHVCPGFLGTAPMKQAGERWERAGDYKIRGAFGEWGKVGSTPAVVSLGVDHPALRFDSAGMAQGYISEAVTFLALEKDGTLREVGAIVEGVSDDGTGECGEPDQPACFKKSFQVRILPERTHGWNDLEASIEGTDRDAKTKKLVKVHRVDRYRYDGTEYAK